MRSIDKFRRRLGQAYHLLFHYKYPEFQGKVWLQFYKLLYPNFFVGKNPKMWGRFYITMYDPLDGEIMIGDNVRMVSDPKRSGMSTFARCKITTYTNASIIIGNNVTMSGATITSKKRIKIGEHSMLSPNVIIIDTDFHVLWPPEKRFDLVSAEHDQEIKIGKNVWIGTNVVILKGVSIGDNSIIGAGSVVTRNIPKNVLAGGNPVRVVRHLNDL
jgi:acetyltransferase-like isoleucine patch superfamily enzyme